ncbi:MAG: hypothetical protein HUJ76_11585, partial [Parasporobacterium sp.]|nr:hypothetical protein [Parasporobacterium sp.]
MNNDMLYAPTEGCSEAIVLKGTPRQMGYQYGRKYAEKWVHYDALIKTSIFETPLTTSLYGFVPPKKEDARRDMQALIYISRKYSPNYVEWIEGLQKGLESRGVELDIEDVVMVATYPDERWARPGGNYPEGFNAKVKSEGTTPNRPYCNGFAASGKATRNDDVIVGVSGSPSDETTDRVMLIAYKDDGSYFSTFGTIPNPFGQSGMSSKGFAFAMTSNTSEVDCSWGVSPEVAAFHLVNDIESVDQAKQWLENIPRSFATGNFIIADDKGDICVCESNNAHFNIRKPGDAGEEGEYVVSTNHFASKETFEFNVPEMEAWKHDSICRLATISQYIKQGIDNGGIDIDWVHHILRQNDWYDSETKEWNYNEPASGKGSDVLEYTHSAFYNPATMMVYYMQGTGGGIGAPAGSMGEFVQFPLMDDVGQTIEMMMMDAFFGNFHTARGEFIRVRNASKVLQQDYASQVALRSLLDESYRNLTFP